MPPLTARASNKIPTLPIIPDCFDRATAQRLITHRLLLVSLRLLVDKRVAVFVRTFEVVRRGVAADVAVDARRVNVVRTGNVLFDFIVFVRHA